MATQHPDEKPPGVRPDNSLLRIKSIIGPAGPIPVSRSTWWAGVRSGRFPKPVKLGPRTTAWRAADIHKLLEGLSQSSD
nr:AlpA family phage regulatory protein [Mesorhizobium sp. 131-2-5]